MIAAAAAQATPPACYADIRAYYQNQLLDSKLRVHVYQAHGYAVAAWSTRHTAGEGVFRRAGNAWCKIVSGGGVLDENGLVRYGVPRDVAQQLVAQVSVAR